jgi:DMSO/TMAO reductase YedYZ heme-binding membrane subunit
MRARRRHYSFANAMSELGFALAAFACGLFDAPTWMAGLAAVSMLVYWAVTRNSVLNRLRGATWATVMTLGFVTIISIQAGAYWLGLVAGEII